MSEKLHICEGCRREVLSKGLPDDWIGIGTSVAAILEARRYHRIAEWCPGCQANGSMDRESKTPAQAERTARDILSAASPSLPQEPTT